MLWWGQGLRVMVVMPRVNSCCCYGHLVSHHCRVKLLTPNFGWNSLKNLSRLRWISQNYTPSMQVSIAAYFFIVCKPHQPCPKGLVHNSDLKHIWHSLHSIRRRSPRCGTRLRRSFSLSLVAVASAHWRSFSNCSKRPQTRDTMVRALRNCLHQGISVLHLFDMHSSQISPNLCAWWFHWNGVSSTRNVRV